MAEDAKKPGAKAPKSDKPTPQPGTAQVCAPSDRATDGLKRFKLRLDGHPGGARSQRYVLAPDRDGATAEYLRTEGIDPADVAGAGSRLVVTELPD